VVSFADLYAGKLAAAQRRCHDLSEDIQNIEHILIGHQRQVNKFLDLPVSKQRPEVVVFSRYVTGTPGQECLAEVVGPNFEAQDGSSAVRQMSWGRGQGSHSVYEASTTRRIAMPLSGLARSPERLARFLSK
jgi:hypothetical protein